MEERSRQTETDTAAARARIEALEGSAAALRAEAQGKAAGQEGKERFSVCPICRRLICDSCFLICEEMDMCRACAKRLKEDGEPVNL